VYVGTEAVIGFVVAGGDGAKLFQLGEAILDQMTPAIHVLIVGNRGLAVGFRRDDGEGAAAVEFRPEPIDIERLVPKQGVKGKVADQRRDAERVMALAGQEHDAHKVAQRIDQRDDLGRQSAA
jgi:hypothetical protein